MKTLCECCKKRNAETVDFRERYGIFQKMYVCPRCQWLNDLTFWSVYARNERKQSKNATESRG